MASNDNSVTLRCGSCGNFLAMPEVQAGQHVECPHCQQVLEVPPAHAIPTDGPPQAVPSNGSSNTFQFNQPAGQSTPSSAMSWLAAQEAAAGPPPHPSSQVALLGENQGPSEPSPPSSTNPFRQWHEGTGPAADEAMASPLPRKKARIPLSYWLMSFLIPYAIAATVGIVILMRNRPPHPLENVQDQGVYQELEEGARRTIVEPNQPLPPDVLPLRLGESRTFGILEVTPVRVYRQKIKYVAYRGSRNFESSDEGLYLALHLKNHGKEAFQPLDPTFNRAFRKDVSPYTFLELGKKEYYGPIIDLATERLKGQNVGELLPEDEMDTVVVAAHEAASNQTSAADASKTQPPDSTLIWRVQLRKGRAELPTRDGRKRMVWATTVIPIAFSPRDVK